ncbi:MAG TPA: DUF4113 domain-containing protein [Desulfarculaceae bacterium]|nr:DUF4113 domain-containing protein [Desulfarculaceae bacterium]
MNDLGPENLIQGSLFDTIDRKRSKKLMRVLDEINCGMGAGMIRYGAVGTGRCQSWKTSFKQRSKSYTTRWDNLLEVS